MKKTDKIFQLQKRTKFQLNNTIKKIIFASSASMIIGLAFGFFFLQMIKQDESTATIMEDTPKSIDSNDELRELAEIEVFVIQGGVFAELENYQNWEKKYNNIGLRVIKWERDDAHYLLAGIANTETTAKQTASKFTEEGLDVYVKQWTVSKANTNLSKAEYEWLLSFINVWNKSLLELEQNGNYTYDAWEEIVYEREEDLSKLNVLNEAIQQLNTKNPEEAQANLLYLLKEYEQIIVNN